MAGKASAVKPVTFNAKTGQLYRTIAKRGPVDFTLAEFREWLKTRRCGGPDLWCCEYSREYLVIEGVSIDHRQPLALGGTGTLDNLAVCTEAENRRKAALPHDQYVALKRMVEMWPREAQADLWRRLAARPSWGGRSRKSKAAQFVAEFNRK